mmetsp:Transcript_22504/g.38429  ORF Transcript_22504/g.38429 Transcript_22504/m.38429 type:complete len:226 (-) Transcript_22504:53-730(-)
MQGSGITLHIIPASPPPPHKSNPVPILPVSRVNCLGPSKKSTLRWHAPDRWDCLTTDMGGRFCDAIPSSYPEVTSLAPVLEFVPEAGALLAPRPPPQQGWALCLHQTCHGTTSREVIWCGEVGLHRRLDPQRLLGNYHHLQQYQDLPPNSWTPLASAQTPGPVWDQSHPWAQAQVLPRFAAAVPCHPASWDRIAAWHCCRLLLWLLRWVLGRGPSPIDRQLQGAA